MQRAACKELTDHRLDRTGRQFGKPCPVTHSIRKLAGLFACLLLAACGIGERMTSSEVVVKRSPARVVAPLMLASVTEAERFLPGLKVVKSRPSERELLFSFPGDGKQDPATLLFEFEPTEGGKATRIVTRVSVPTITMTLNGQRKLLSGRLVGAGVSRIMAGMVNGKSEAETTQQFSAILTALAISTDAKLREKAIGMAEAPKSALREIMEREGEAAELAISDGNDFTEYDAPRDDSEEFAPDRERISDDQAGSDFHDGDRPAG